MARSIEDNSSAVLAALAGVPRENSTKARLSGEQLAEITGLSPSEINDTVTVLVESGLVEWMRWLGTAPFSFGGVWITPRGRYEFERSRQRLERRVPQTDAPKLLPPSPTGSPYGFSDEDWEVVAERKHNTSVLYVVLGYQFRSDHYDSTLLQQNVEIMFERAVEEYNAGPTSIPARLDFQPLGAGYGEHLFNEIARDIIGADIAVFDTSDLNPNVMLEVGVALTWGVRVLPIKKEGCPKPPSDVSGQTWAEYEDSAGHFVDPDHMRKLIRMIERAVKKKGRG